MMNLIPIKRKRLVDRMNTPDIAPLTLITAPSGYGKSTLASQWASTFPGVLVRITILPGANTPSRLMRQILQTITSSFPELEFRRAGETTLDAVLDILQQVVATGESLGILIDDYHLIDNQDVHNGFTIGINRLPDGVHIVLLSRTPPPLKLGRLHAHGKVRHLTEADLCFTVDEVEAIASQVGLSDTEARKLIDRTDGWIAGIRLAMMSLDLTSGDHDQRFDLALQTLHEDHWLNDYVVEEILGDLPDDVRQFVLQTSILEVLAPDLCDTVLGIDDSVRLLADIEQRGLFVSRPGTHLRYHRLFAECVERIRDRVMPGETRREQSLRAAQWFEDHEQPELAVGHALRGGDPAKAIILTTRICRPLIDRDLLHTTLFWLQNLPTHVRRSDAYLSFEFTKCLFYTGQLHQAAEEMRLHLPRWRSSDDPLQHGYAASCEAIVLALRGDPAFLRKMYEIVHVIPLDNRIQRLHAWAGIHEHEYLRGNDDIAGQAYRQAAISRSWLPPDQYWWLVQIEPNRANHHALRADLESAKDILHRLLEQSNRTPRRAWSKYRIRLAAIHLEQNELEHALDEARQVHEDIADFPVQAWYLDALLVIAQVHRACGDHDRAEATLQELFTLHREHGGMNAMDHALAWRALCHVADGKISLAREWAATHSPDETGAEHTFGERDTRIPHIALLVADGAPEQASALARQCITEAESTRHHPALIEFNVWEAIARIAMGDEKAALDALRQAITLGTPGRFVRPFFPDGHDLRPALRRLQPTLPPDEAAWVDHLLARNPLAPDRGAQPGLPVPLTPAELGVLDLLNLGHTNRAIADELFITERTVKKHVSNILRKLDVPNRTSAVTTARELRLID